MKVIPSLLVAVAAAPAVVLAVEESVPMTKKLECAPAEGIWRWTSLTGAESLDVAHPARYTLELHDDGRYAIRADCNTGSGAYQRDGKRISLSPGPLTQAACGPGSLGDRFVALLGRVTRFATDGDRLILELGDGAASMEFEAMKPIHLQGTSWLVRGYNNGKGGVVSVGGNAALYVTFNEDGRVSGSAGCNNYTGGYELDGQTIVLGQMASTRKMCQGEGVMQQEAAFLAALANAATWEARGERLQLRRADGALALDLVSAVTGTVVFPVPRELPTGAEIRLSLQDISRMDVPATIIGEQVIAAAGIADPVSFQLTFDPAQIDPRYSYGLRATVTLEGKLIYTSTRAYPVITRDAPRYDIEIQVESVGR
jgi:heat shock protein HslJ